MPRSRRRKGTKAHSNRSGRGHSMTRWDFDRPKAYYDPGVKPKPPNPVKALIRAQRPRRNARGS